MNWTENIEVFNEDGLQVMKRYSDNYFDLAVVDPDYGLDDKISSGGTWAAKYKKGDGELGGKPDGEYFKELFRVSKNQIVWGGNYFLEFLPSSRCFLIWDKKARMETLADCEMAWTSFDANAKIFTKVRNTSEKRIHITQKPISLYQWSLSRFAKQGFKILDTHLGSGSIAIAVDSLNKIEKMNLSLVASEIDPIRYDKAKERVLKKTAWQSIF